MPTAEKYLWLLVVAAVLCFGLGIAAIVKADSFHQEVTTPPNWCSSGNGLSVALSGANLGLLAYAPVTGPLYLTVSCSANKLIIDAPVESAPWPDSSLIAAMTAGIVPVWMQRAVISAAGPVSADLNQDGIVNINDMNLLKAQINRTPPPRYVCFTDAVSNRFAVAEWGKETIKPVADCSAASTACFGDARACQ